MFRVDRIALATVRQLARAALGLLGLTILIGWNAPTPEPAASASSRRGDLPQTPRTVTLGVPEGALATNVTVVDASGRELAVVTRWLSGTTTVVSRRDGGVGVSYHLHGDGSARMRMAGSEKVSVIDGRPDGTAQVAEISIAPCGSPEISSRIRARDCESSGRVMDGRAPEHASQPPGPPPRSAG
jgi:hypothetical protein